MGDKVSIRLQRASKAGDVVILRYKTAGQCLRAYFGVDDNDPLPNGDWE